VPYGIIKTQKKDGDGVRGGPTHWLLRGTLVRVVKDGEDYSEVETLYPVFGYPIPGTAPMYKVRTQYLSPSDYYEIPGRFGPMLEAWAEYFQRVREYMCLA
jgi:hypothetical protein